MREIDFEQTNRKKVYNWFKTFSNPTYSCCVKMDVTKLVNHCKKEEQSFFINMLYIVVKGLNSVEQLRIRYVDGKNILYDDINPSYTVMSDYGFYDNVKQKNNDNYQEFYQETIQNVNNIKKEKVIQDVTYNNNSYDYYYITCLPWLDFTEIKHPIPDNKESQCVPRICWGKYEEDKDKFHVMLNITVSHMYVDGRDLANAFIEIQKLLDSIDQVLK